MPSGSATWFIAAHFESWSPRISATICRHHPSSPLFHTGGYLREVFPDMTPAFPRIGVSGHAGGSHLEGARGWLQDGISDLCSLEVSLDDIKQAGFALDVPWPGDGSDAAERLGERSFAEDLIS